MTYRPDSRYPKNWNRLRHVVFTRDSYICQECGKVLDRTTKGRIPHCHHVIPIAYGGNHHISNLLTLCPCCHRRIHKEHIEKKNKKKVKK